MQQFKMQVRPCHISGLPYCANDLALPYLLPGMDKKVLHVGIQRLVPAGVQDA